MRTQNDFLQKITFLGVQYFYVDEMQWNYDLEMKV